MAQPDLTPMQQAALGRSAARYLAILIREHALTEKDGKRLIEKIIAGYDAILEPAQPAKPVPLLHRLTLITGGRA